MAAPRKPKAALLRETLKNPPQTHEQDTQNTYLPPYADYAPSPLVPVSCRLNEIDRDRIARYATERGLKPAQLIRAWILERMKFEGLR